MPKPATGSIRWTRGPARIALARITLAGKRETLRMEWCSCDNVISERDEQRARERGNKLAAFAQRMSKLDRPLALKYLERLANATPGPVFEATCKATDRVIGGFDPRTASSQTPTLRQVGERWTSGKLRAEFPDDVRDTSASCEHHQRTLKNHVYPTLGDIPLDVLTLDHCDLIKKNLPAQLQGNTRRNVLRFLQRILSIAVYPLRLIEHSPLPRGWVPRPTQRKAMSALYPENDAALMARTEIPLCWRMLWGFLDREGARDGEAIRLTIGDFDLDRGAVRVDRTKTKTPRAWALQPGTTAALRTWLREFRPDAKRTDRMFISEAGRPIPRTHRLPELLREHQRAIGLDEKRPELFEHTKERQRMRVHDLRGTFVTIALATGRTEAWVAERTGHMSSEMINAYKRTAQTFEQLHVDALAPLVDAVPELRARDVTAPPTRGTAGRTNRPAIAPRSANLARSLQPEKFSQISFNDAASCPERTRSRERVWQAGVN